MSALAVLGLITMPLQALPRGHTLPDHCEQSGTGHRNAVLTGSSTRPEWEEEKEQDTHTIKGGPRHNGTTGVRSMLALGVTGRRRCPARRGKDDRGKLCNSGSGPSPHHPRGWGLVLEMPA